jgi:hypothetical protein
MAVESSSLRLRKNPPGMMLESGGALAVPVRISSASSFSSKYESPEGSGGKFREKRSSAASDPGPDIRSAGTACGHRDRSPVVAPVQSPRPSISTLRTPDQEKYSAQPPGSAPVSPARPGKDQAAALLPRVWPAGALGEVGVGMAAVALREALDQVFAPRQPLRRGRYHFGLEHGSWRRSRRYSACLLTASL